MITRIDHGPRSPFTDAQIAEMNTLLAEANAAHARAECAARLSWLPAAVLVAAFAYLGIVVWVYA